MIQLGQDPDLALEAFDLAVAPETRAEDLDRDAPTDAPVLGLEAGTQKTVAKLAADPQQDFKDKLERMGRLESERLIVRAEFVRGSVDNSKDNEVKAWIRNLSDVRPARIQILTPAKAKDGQKPVTKTRMKEIAELVQEKTGIAVDVLSD